MVCENILTSHSCNDHTKPSYDQVQYILSSIQIQLRNEDFTNLSFIGIILIPIVGNAAEHVTACVIAIKIEST
jgi:hypothetical protein